MSKNLVYKLLFYIHMGTGMLFTYLIRMSLSYNCVKLQVSKVLLSIDIFNLVCQTVA